MPSSESVVSVGPPGMGPVVDATASQDLGGRDSWARPRLVVLNDVASGQQGAGYASDGPNPDVGVS